MSMDLRRKSSSKVAAVAVKWEAQGMLQQSADDSGQPLLSLQILLILLTSYTRSIKNPRASQTKEAPQPFTSKQGCEVRPLLPTVPMMEAADKR